MEEERQDCVREGEGRGENEGRGGEGGRERRVEGEREEGRKSDRDREKRSRGGVEGGKGGGLANEITTGGHTCNTFVQGVGSEEIGKTSVYLASASL